VLSDEYTSYAAVRRATNPNVRVLGRQTYAVKTDVHRMTLDSHATVELIAPLQSLQFYTTTTTTILLQQQHVDNERPADHAGCHQ
jgi:hypothetical protein